jgi:hypothetical protein
LLHPAADPGVRCVSLVHPAVIADRQSPRVPAARFTPLGGVPSSTAVSHPCDLCPLVVAPARTARSLDLEALLCG